MARRVQGMGAALAATVLVLVAAAACDDEGSTCTPGEQANCGCPGGAQGIQGCLPDGTFGGCECGEGGGSPATTTSTASGQGGDGVGGMAPCAPAAIEDCYDGPSGTENVGPCVGGTRICGNDGMWGACMNQVLPTAEDCQTVQ